MVLGSAGCKQAPTLCIFLQPQNEVLEEKFLSIILFLGVGGGKKSHTGGTWRTIQCQRLD